MNAQKLTPKELISQFETKKVEGSPSAPSIINELEHQMNNEDKTLLCNTTPVSFIERYCSKLNISAELTNVCKFIAIRIQRSNLIPENTPHSIAAGIVYFVAQECHLNVSKTAVNTISEISEVTINKCYKKLEAIKDTLIPQVIITKYS